MGIYIQRPERASDSLEMELQAVVSHLFGCWKQSGSSVRAQLISESFLQPIKFNVKTEASGREAEKLSKRS